MSSNHQPSTDPVDSHASAKFALLPTIAVCQQVARLVRARLPIPGQLAKAAQDSSAGVATLANKVDHDLAQGKSLVQALAAEESAEARVLAACVEAGESSNHLDDALFRWTDMHIANARARRSFRNAMFYPCLLILITLASLSLVVAVLIPEYEATYALLDYELPGWLQWILAVREHMGWFALCLLCMCLIPTLMWYGLRHRLKGRYQFSRGKGLRSQALAAETAAMLLAAQQPLNRVAPLTVQAAGGSREDVEQAFSRVQSQQPAEPLVPEATMLLTSLHAGVLSVEEASQNFLAVAKHLRQVAEVNESRQARWLPMLVALSVGLVIVAVYVLLIYLPWIWLMQKMVSPTS